MLQRVQFTSHFPPYSSGEVAGFDAIEASELVAAGVAVELSAPIDEVRAQASVIAPSPVARKRGR